MGKEEGTRLGREERESQDETYNKANQPDPRVIPKRQLLNKTLRFQEK